MCVSVLEEPSATIVRVEPSFTENQQVPPKCCDVCTRLHGVTSKATAVFTLAVMRTSDASSVCSLYSCVPETLPHAFQEWFGSFCTPVFQQELPGWWNIQYYDYVVIKPVYTDVMVRIVMDQQILLYIPVTHLLY
jgi:hypothetical protein